MEGERGMVQELHLNFPLLIPLAITIGYPRDRNYSANERKEMEGTQHATSP